MDVQTLGEVMGWSCSRERYAELLPGYIAACKAADIDNPNRAAMFAAQLGHESVGLKYMEEIADGSAYEGRRDLGNVYAGDGRRYKGRGPIQLTGRANYRAFTSWARTKGLTNIDFEAEPHRLSEPQWGFLAASYYWVIARPQINSLSDRQDLEGVTRAINGGLNGIQERRNRYNKALRMAGALLAEGGKTMEKVLDYPRTQIAQDTYYNCGPASTQTIVWAATDKFYTEAELGRRLGTTTNGTNWIGLFPKVLNDYIPGAEYVSAEMPNDPPTKDQKEKFWNDLVGSINAGHGVVANIVAPPSNYPKAVAPSTISPAYRGGTVYHYIALMGYSEVGGYRKVWVADSGFTPYGYWIGFDQLATLIPPKGYAYSKSKAKIAPETKKEGDGAVTFKQMTDFITGFFGPQFEALQEVWRQLRGPQGNGWAQLGQNAQGQNLSLVDAVAALRRDVAELRKEIQIYQEGRK